MSLQKRPAADENGERKQCRTVDGQGSIGFHDFDVPVNRSKVYSVKHGLHFASSSHDVIPMWVADMDLPCCPEIQKALAERAAHPTFGYTYQPGEIWDSVSSWLQAHQGWPVGRPTASSFIFSPSVVTSFVCAFRAFSEPGEAVLLMTPLYAPLQKAVQAEGRRLVRHQLIHPLSAAGRAAEGESGSPGTPVFEYGIDWPELEAQLKAESVRLLLLCNPHNPSGRVWRRDELTRLAALCRENGVLILSDEIHADWCLWGNEFVPMAAVVSDPAAVVTFGAPTKTWNLAGLMCSFLIIEDEAMRRKYASIVDHAFLQYGGTFATTAMLAAYQRGEPWLRKAKAYVEGNISEVQAYFDAHLAEVQVWRPQATFLVWLDFSRLGCKAAELKAKLAAAGVVFSSGEEFAPESAHFQRMNVALSRTVLRQALGRVSKAVAELRLSNSGLPTVAADT
ncbi:unnamed protein product [Polarella glacialis]|uniref:cysteine-S-conjugate beta-lyase n=1 Tax=Polarella glacialis TaxID=89957 RepID=A0A813LN04_POLGL|nr:unnamed protein product [Polarella glacialis]CAE8734016.1 unnamed protein product [Polarella glacialis]